jgi:type II secretory pathway pseudopilin PulG
MKVAKRRAMCRVVLILLCGIIMSAAAQSSSADRSSSQETQARGYWVDPATHLMWAGKDNGKDVSWKGAVKYCQNLRTSGFSDWRLATLAELGGIYDKNANSPGRVGKRAVTWPVKGNLFLSGQPWSSEYCRDDRGRNSGYSWYFDFGNGRPNSDPSG